ncbi:hypothetical protein SUGI_0705600 [Cryptomeria japonica]|nr:hypothetical protein SUGI_0705600 [Cryptomeria japonica]
MYTVMADFGENGNQRVMRRLGSKDLEFLSGYGLLSFQLEGAEERLILVKADLLDYKNLAEASNGCQGVFHVASPVTDDLLQMLEPVVNGTKNVLDAVVDVGACHLVFTSSIGAVYMDPKRDYDSVVDESC